MSQGTKIVRYFFYFILFSCRRDFVSWLEPEVCQYMDEQPLPRRQWRHTRARTTALVLYCFISLGLAPGVENGAGCLEGKRNASRLG